MNISIETPALLFPAISLLLLAYTNRFLSLAKLVRELTLQYESSPDDPRYRRQVSNLRLRLTFIRIMQSFGIASIFSCLVAMLGYMLRFANLSPVLFIVSLVLLMVAVSFSFAEIQISTRALSVELDKSHQEKKLDLKV